MAPSTAAPKDARLLPTAEGQHGVFHLTQARAAGLTASDVAWRVTQGRYTRLLPSVLAVRGTPASWRRDQMAACLWAGERSAASHGAAARLWGVPSFRAADVEVSIVGNRRPKRMPFRVHRVGPHMLAEIRRVDGIPVTSPRRTILDLAGVRHPATERALDHCLRTDLCSLGQLWLLYDEEWTRGRRGIAVLRALLVDRTIGEAPAQSELEDLMRRLIRSHALPTPSVQWPVDIGERTIHVDFAYPHERVAIETDGYAWHMDRQAFERDRERDNALSARGWKVLRFTWAKLRWDPDYVVRTIALHLSSSSGPSVAPYSALGPLGVGARPSVAGRSG